MVKGLKRFLPYFSLIVLTMLVMKWGGLVNGDAATFGAIMWVIGYRTGR